MKRRMLRFALFCLVSGFMYAQSVLLDMKFDDGTQGRWYGRGSTSLRVTNESAHSPAYSVLASGRTQSWNGPALDLTETILTGGVYDFSAWVRPKSARKMIMTIERSKSGKTSWDRIVAVDATANEWTRLAGRYDAANDFDKVTVYIESEDPTLEFYIDDVSVSVVKVPAQPSEPAKLEDLPSLFEAYKDYFAIGTCVELDQLHGKENEIILKHFSSITAENVMKPQYMAIDEKTVNFTASDALVAYAEKNGKLLRGHTLLWHQQNAEWMFYDKAGKFVSKKVLLKRLENYIKAVVGRYKGRVYAWDVVNEVVDGAGLRRSLWLDIAGEEYIEKAFIYAREADPKAKLFINEYETTDSVKMDALYRLVKRLLEKGIPVDGIGMQYHITLTYPSLQSISASMKKFSELGLEIHITELDMSVNGDPNFSPTAAPEELMIRQAHRYKEIFDIFKQYKNITNVTFWGFQDGHTWLTYSPIRKADWPLLFDAELKPKYAFWGLVDPGKLPRDVAPAESRNRFVGKAKRGTPVVDGQEDAVWANAEDMKIDLLIEGKGATGIGKALWDEKNLYVLIKVKDAVLSKKNAEAYQQDSIEVFVDEKNDKASDYGEDDAQYRLNFENSFSSRGNPAKFQSATLRVSDGYYVEMLIPFRFVTPRVGTRIGFDLQINDDSGVGRRDSIAKWNDPTNNSYRDTSGFGSLILE